MDNENKDFEEIILDKYNMAKIFNIIKRGQSSYYNICKTIRFKNLNSILPKYYKDYIVTSKDTWTNISYKFYGTYKLWWLICKFNDVQDPFFYLEQGMKIKIPTEQLINGILQNLGNM